MAFPFRLLHSYQLHAGRDGVGRAYSVEQWGRGISFTCWKLPTQCHPREHCSLSSSGRGLGSGTRNPNLVSCNYCVATWTAPRYDVAHQATCGHSVVPRNGAYGLGPTGHPSEDVRRGPFSLPSPVHTIVCPIEPESGVLGCFQYVTELAGALVIQSRDVSTAATVLNARRNSVSSFSHRGPSSVNGDCALACKLKLWRSHGP